MMKTVAQNDCYVISVDLAKNRAYLTLLGYWKSRADVPRYIDDWKDAVNELSRGFTVLSDTRRMKTPPQDVVQLHAQAQKALIAAGLSKTAELVGSDAIARLAVDRFSRESGMYKGTFDSWEEANAWLDKKEASL